MGDFWKFAVRDALIIAVVATLWTAFAHVSAGTGLWSDFAGLMLGLAFGVCVYLLHEWGHLLGGLATGSTVYAPERLTSPSLFSFDSKRNTRRQFLVMSFSGFVVTGLAVWCAYSLLTQPLQAARVARGAIMFLAALTVGIEFPLVLWSLVSSSLPPVEAFEGGRSPLPSEQPSSEPQPSSESARVRALRPELQPGAEEQKTTA